jgi:hypothetical protein
MMTKVENLRRVVNADQIAYARHRSPGTCRGGPLHHRPLDRTFDGMQNAQLTATFGKVPDHVSTCRTDNFPKTLTPTKMPTPIANGNSQLQ